MRCSVNELLEKDVIEAATGNRIGYICDVELDLETACLSAFIVAVKCKNASFIAKYEKVRIDWCDIKVIGKDAVLVNCKSEWHALKEEKNIFEKLWN